MFIPARYGTGVTTVACVALEGGVLTAGCEVIHKLTTYPASSNINVLRGDAITLRTTITGRASIPVELAGKSYTWEVDTPKNIRFVTDLAFQRITGTTYGKVHRYPGEALDYVESGTINHDQDLIASIDYSKNEIWFFGSTGVKKISTPETPVAVVYTPRWSDQEGIETQPWIVTESGIYPVTSSMELSVEDKIDLSAHGAAIAATGDTQAILIATSTNVLRVLNGVVTELANIGGHAIQYTHDGRVVLGQDAGTVVAFQLLSPDQHVVLYDAGAEARFQISTENSEKIYAVDMVNRRVISMDANTSSTVQLRDVPSGVSVHEESVYVGFFNAAKTLKYSLELEVVEEIETVKAKGVAFDSSLVVTDLYSNANDVTQAESVTNVVAQSIDVDVDVESVDVDVNIEWPRPMFVAVPEGTSVLRNGQPFESGYVASPDVLTITIPLSGEYYTPNQINLLGDIPISVYACTEPKLFPNPVVLDSVLEAWPRRVYEDSFVVEGITDTFTVSITSSESNILTFSINNGEVGTSGSIKNGDVVHVYGTIKNFLEVRTLFTLDTPSGNAAAEWTILARQLNGAQHREDSRIEQEKNPVRLVEMDASASVAAHESAISVIAQTMLTVSEFDPKVTQFATGMFTKSEFEAAKAVMAQSFATVGEYQPIAVRYVSDSEVEWVRHFIDNSLGSAIEPELSAPILYAPRVQHNLDLTYTAAVSLQGVNVEFEFSASVLHQRTAFELDTNFGKLDSNATEVEWPYAHQNYNAGVDLDSNAHVLRSRNTYALSTVYDKKSHNSYSVPMVFARLTFKHREISANFGMSRYALRTEFDLIGFLAFSALRVEFDLGAEIFKHRTYVDLSEYGITVQRRTFAEVDANGAVLHNKTHVQKNANSGIQAGALRVEIDSDMDVLQRPAVDVSTMFVLVQPGVGVAVNMPEARWVTQHGNSTSTDDTGFFDTLQEAEAYADELNLEDTTPPQFVQFNGKWIVLSTPVADNAVCSIANLPPELQRKYGYLGGG